MKKILLVAFLLIPFISFSQTRKPIDGFLGIKFGASKASVIAAIKAKGGKLDIANSNADVKMFMNVIFASKTPVVLIVKFLGDKFYIATFLFKADSDSETIGYYDDLVNSLTGKYGVGKSTNTFSAGFADGDGKEIDAIQSGNADYHTSWNSGNGSIVIGITSKLYIGLTCKDDKLLNAHTAAQSN